jgi:uncharacterized membrane protein (UPF0182 family)
MKKLFRSGLVLSPYLSLAVPLFLFGSLLALGYLLPNLFCMEMEPGGKEFICGARYTHIAIQLLQQIGLAVWVLLVGTGGAELLRRRATRPAVMAWSISALILSSSVLLLITLPRDVCP